MKKNINSKIYYGLFYKSQGKWVGPYMNVVLNPKQVGSYVKNLLPRDKAVLKSKTQLRKLQFV